MTNSSDQNESIPNQGSNQSVQHDIDFDNSRAESASEQAHDQAADVIPDALANQAEKASDQVADQVQAAKSAVTSPLPKPPAMSTTQADPKDLLKRLNWGEPALTIIDARSREAFNAERITGAMSMDQLPNVIESALEHKRDIYVYGDGGDEGTEVANHLRQAGYEKVALLQGGLSAWKDIGGPTEGVEAFSSPVAS
ncbi:MAG TPA: rhodanese-like domain-containing protein [Nodosilinea sp.]|jgi:rhodanese-related sulfurtransferase|nr:rhodanese-like domain-containing protein [Nodosilinea sp.]